MGGKKAQKCRVMLHLLCGGKKVYFCVLWWYWRLCFSIIFNSFGKEMQSKIQLISALWKISSDNTVYVYAFGSDFYPKRLTFISQTGSARSCLRTTIGDSTFYAGAQDLNPSHPHDGQQSYHYTIQSQCSYKINIDIWIGKWCWIAGVSVMSMYSQTCSMKTNLWLTSDWSLMKPE